MSQKPPPTKLSQIQLEEDRKDCLWGSFCVTILLLFGIWLYFSLFSEDSQPYKPVEFSIADASITQFNLTSDNTLYYNFKFNISVRNPHFGQYMSEIYDISAISSYKGNKFAMVDMESFDADFKNTILKPVVFYGNSLIKFNAQQLMEYDNETLLKKFNLDLKLNLKHNEYVYCIGLRVPLISNEKLESSFNVTECSREYQGWG
ncbi:NDR1/HIN1-like protein 10 [Vicia villosa]|uniref:NDR1/HIN1-like protein 10 n=1 Tax=Vicia villosa TaxID=3911 RepID=UPI00273CC9AF|nr:NDR1/HIN1-like protein 10 [Vicia villosa]